MIMVLLSQQYDRDGWVFCHVGESRVETENAEMDWPMDGEYAPGLGAVNLRNL